MVSYCFADVFVILCILIMLWVSIVLQINAIYQNKNSVYLKFILSLPNFILMIVHYRAYMIRVICNLIGYLIIDWNFELGKNKFSNTFFSSLFFILSQIATGFFSFSV